MGYFFWLTGQHLTSTADRVVHRAKRVSWEINFDDESQFIYVATNKAVYLDQYDAILFWHLVVGIKKITNAIFNLSSCDDH